MELVVNIVCGGYSSLTYEAAQKWTVRELLKCRDAVDAFNKAQLENK